jgi:hypothetical protein
MPHFMTATVVGAGLFRPFLKEVVHNENPFVPANTDRQPST